MLSSDVVAVARAVGARVRVENGAGFVTLPKFLDVHENSRRPADARQARLMAALLEAFREGGKSQFADTLAFADSTRLSQLPDSATWLFTLSTEPSGHGDSATVEIYGGQAIPYGPIERE